jgi:hypothetical protein
MRGLVLVPRLKRLRGTCMPWRSESSQTNSLPRDKFRYRLAPGTAGKAGRVTGSLIASGKREIP